MARAELPLIGAGGEPVDFWRTVNSHGLNFLPPARIDDDARTIELTLHPGPHTVVVRGAGRMMRSATVFEDVVKTICTTNCAWSGTVRMVTALVENLGEVSDRGQRAFPAPQAMAAAPE